MKAVCLLLCSMLLILNTLGAKPPEKIPVELRDDYTLKDAIPVYFWYFDDTYSKTKKYSRNLVEAYIKKVQRRECFYYGETDTFLYRALDEMAEKLKGKEVAVIGSVTPWYEAILLCYGARPVVIEYNKLSTNFPGITYLTPSQYAANPKKFDFILSISSTEHDGLGRYGDPLNPNGDLDSMATFKDMLTENGKLILAVPVGQDALVWNAHRIYGPLRLPMLLEGWTVENAYGFDESNFSLDHNTHHQPVFVLMADRD